MWSKYRRHQTSLKVFSSPLHSLITSTTLLYSSHFNRTTRQSMMMMMMMMVVNNDDNNDDDNNDNQRCIIKLFHRASNVFTIIGSSLSFCFHYNWERIRKIIRIWLWRRIRKWIFRCKVKINKKQDPNWHNIITNKIQSHTNII